MKNYYPYLDDVPHRPVTGLAQITIELDDEQDYVGPMLTNDGQVEFLPHQVTLHYESVGMAPPKRPVVSMHARVLGRPYQEDGGDWVFPQRNFFSARGDTAPWWLDVLAARHAPGWYHLTAKRRFKREPGTGPVEIKTAPEPKAKPIRVRDAKRGVQPTFNAPKCLDTVAYLGSVYVCTRRRRHPGNHQDVAKRKEWTA